MVPHFGCVPESEFITLPPCEPDKHSFLGSCQLLLELPEGLEHFAERGCPLPPPDSLLVASWLLHCLAGLSLPTLPGKDPAWVW